MSDDRSDSFEHEGVLPLIEALPDPILLVNARREIVAANSVAHDKLGTVLLGRDFSLSVRHPDALAAVSDVLAGEPAPRGDADRIGACGTDVRVERRGSAGGRPGSARPCRSRERCRRNLPLRDVTAAWGAERIRSDFVANVSHELRSPLSVLIGFIETLKGPASGDHAALKRFLDIMDAESRRMARLVDDLLSLSRVESSEHVPPSGTVNVHDMISETCESFATRAAEKEITIEMELDADVGAIPGDRDELLEVLHNLVDNAIKYGRHKSVVRIDTRRESRIPETGVAGIAITVTNLGEVIASEHLPRLTERFYRVDKGRSRSAGGTGLGLAIVKHIVNHHRGRLLIASTPEKGNAVTVFLPLAHPG